jgi:two-component system sensor histidine kinase ResE
MTGQTRYQLESFDLRTLLANVEKTYQGLAQSRGVSVKVMEFAKPLFWPVDTAHITVAVNQIVENAIQATDRDGFVTLKLAATPMEVEILISDTGVGIAKEDMPTLFEQFKSVGDINNRKMGGLGLGLFIAKSLIEGHRGTITVDSTVGEGTRVSIRIPKSL